MKKVQLLLLLLGLSSLVSAQNIFRTACNGNLSRLDSLLKQTTLDTRDNRGMSLLHWAVACKQQKIFDYLIDKGIAVNAENNLGATPIQIAVRLNRTHFFDLLTRLQPDPKWKVTYGGALLETAVLKNNSSFIKKLLETGIDINSLNSRGSTALEIAKRTGKEQMVAWLIEQGADLTKVRNIVVKGDYMGQADPGEIPQIFAPNFISTEEYEFGAVFNKAGNEFYYGVDVNGKAEIRYSKRIDGKWQKPITLLEHQNYGYNDPFLSNDEQRLYFISQRPLDGGEKPKKDHDIWYVERRSKGWSSPINAGPMINTNSSEYYISFTKDEILYFASDKATENNSDDRNHDIYYSKFIDGAFQEALRLDAAINSPNYEADAFIDPDENYLIFCSFREEGMGRGDLYISFKNSDGTWTKAVNMGNEINTVGHELCPFVTKDGKYFFYTSKEDIYWVSTKIFDKIKRKLTD